MQNKISEQRKVEMGYILEKPRIILNFSHKPGKKKEEEKKMFIPIHAYIM